MTIKFVRDDTPPQPDPPGTEGWREDPDECMHDFRAVGMTDYGTLYECSKCGGLTP